MLSPTRHKNLKPVLAVLSCLMMVSAFVTSGLVRVEASNPNQGSLTMHLVLDSTDWEGYHAIGHSIKAELAKIGITVELDYRETGVYDDTVFGDYWNYTWDDAPGYGWDMTFGEFWGMPTSLLWWPRMYSAAGMPPGGWQIMSWNNTKADSLLDLQFGEFDPVKRRQLMLLYQQEWVHDTPGPVLYSPEFIQVVDRRFQTPWGTPGWEEAAWWYDPFLYTWVEDPMPEKVTVKFATAEGWWEHNPIYMWTCAQRVTQCLTHSMLYVVSKEYGSAVGEGFTVRPYLASADPVWADDYLTCNISLRNDVYWHDFEDIWTPGGPYTYTNELFTADDVVMTFAALMDPYTGAWGSWDYVDVLDTSVHPGGCEKLDDFTVRFHLERPYVEFKDLLANERAAFILPEHIFGGLPHGDWYNHWTNREHPPPGTGPFRFVEEVPDEYWKIEAVPNYPAGLNPFGYTPVIDEIIGYAITDPGGYRIMMIENHDIHFSPGPLDATPEQIEAANATGEFWVFNSPIPCTRHLMFNLNHPILSNRYVRQAIAHAIDYTHIVDDILPLAALNGHLQATPVWRSLEWAYPTPAEEALYNIGSYEYNIAVAQQYMNMWKYSLPLYAPYGSPEVDMGPVGDADFSGNVDLDDFIVWATNVATTPPDWIFLPGNDIDPDFDNNGYVDLTDLILWIENYGEYYPFPGGRSITPLAAEYPTIYVEPAAIEDTAYEPGTSFNVSIWTNYTGNDIWGYDFDLYYNPNVLHGGINKTDTWTGDGGTTLFVTTGKPILEDSEKVYVNGTLKTRDMDYEIIYEPGLINFMVAPGAGAEVKATYLYDGVVNGDLITTDKHLSASFIAGTFNNTAGKLSLTGARFYFVDEPVPLTSGPGILANVTFTVVGYGTSDIALGDETKLKGYIAATDTFYDIIKAKYEPDHIQNGFFSNEIPGDVNSDRDVDASDLFDLSKAYGSEPGDANWNERCDFNRDKKVDASDLFALSRNYGKTVEIDDYTLWQENFANEYPFPGAR